MLRAAAAAASVIVAAVAGVVTTYATQRSSLGLWAALGVLVILGAILQALVTGRDKPSAGPAGSGSDEPWDAALFGQGRKADSPGNNLSSSTV